MPKQDPRCVKQKEKIKNVTRTRGARKAPADGRAPRIRVMFLIFFNITNKKYCTVLYRTVQYCTVLYSTVQYCTVLYSTVQYWTVLYKNICVGKIGFGHEKKLRWGLSTRVLNFVGGIKKNNIIIIGPFSRGGLEKPNPARTIDTLADRS